MAPSSRLRARVAEVYSTAAENPEAPHPFPIGRHFAAGLGYPLDLLDALPRPAVEAFTGVSCVSLLATFPPGAHVLDLGCGAGLDTLIAARRTGPAGRVTAVDFSEPMLRRAQQAVREASTDRVLLCRAAAEQLPLPDHSVDVALVNGIFNLNPGRRDIFRELARVVRPGGVVYAAELILAQPLPAEPCREADWFA
ncbi:MAG: methyltransferase domain-containing protein [Bryobacteraceae bacterium]|jgi:arsenite methyltransferase|nr:methyltransferase domain-containing protein [Bryobacteraceae bacterium]